MNELPRKKYLRPDEVADFWRVDVKTVYRWVAMGIIDADKIGGTVRISREEAEKRRSVLE
jgi:excisionase family DNA binding protein